MKHLSLLLVLAFSGSLYAATPAKDFSPYVNAQGEISLPSEYRQSWSHLGSWLIADAAAPGYGFHDVYVQSGSLDYYLQHNEFPDGAVLIKEVRDIKLGAQTTGLAQWAGEIKIWFVMVKDSQNRFPNNSHWAEGWGWALFDKTSGKNISDGFSASCKACHLPAQPQDWIFTGGYPSLRSRKSN